MALGALAGCGGGSDAADRVAPGTKLFDLQFVDAQTAYGVAGQGLIARSDDGGQPVLLLYALDAAGRGWAGTDSSLLHSSDGGRHWTVVAAPAVPNIQVGVALDGMGWLTRANGVAEWFSTDAGATWRHFDGVPVDAIQANIVRDGGGGLLASVGWQLTGYTWQRSIDDGRSWRTLL